MARGNQLARQWQLLQLVDSPAGIAVGDAARKLGCTIRTIWRDLEVLELAGLPLYSIGFEWCQAKHADCHGKDHTEGRRCPLRKVCPKKARGRLPFGA